MVRSNSSSVYTRCLRIFYVHDRLIYIGCIPYLRPVADRRCAYGIFTLRENSHLSEFIRAALHQTSERNDIILRCYTYMYIYTKYSGTSDFNFSNRFLKNKLETLSVSLFSNFKKQNEFFNISDYFSRRISCYIRYTNYNR